MMSFSRLHVLLVEPAAGDLEVIDRRIRRALAGTAFEIEHATDWDHAGERVASAAFDLLVVSCGSPFAEAGFRFVEQARARELQTPAILLIDDASSEERAIEALRGRAGDCFEKRRLAHGDLRRSIRVSLALDAAERTRREADTALRASEARLRALVDNSADAVALIGADGVVRYASPSTEQVLGYRADAFVGTNVFDLIHPEDVAFASALFEVIGGNPQRALSLELRLRHRDGSWRHIEGMAHNRLADPPIGAIVAYFRDVTARLETERAIVERERQFRTLFDTALDAMVILDDERRFLDANRAACALYGAPEEQLLERRLDDFVEPRALDALEAQWQAFLAAGELKGESAQRMLDASERSIEFSATANFLSGRHLLILRDITDRKRLEWQLVQSQKMETVGRLAGGIAHDFNNLLTGILGYSNLALEQLDHKAQVRTDLEEIKKAGERAAALTRQLLAFSRRQVLRPVMLDLNDVVLNLESMLCRVLGEDIELRVTLDRGIGRVQVDPVQIEQVILNLAVNSRDAMPAGGRLIIETKAVVIDEAYAARHQTMEKGPHALLAVSDSGCGMTPEVCAHVFEPFFTTKPQGQGTGLGLATVYGIVKQSGGSIWVYSEPNVGTTFKIYVPIAVLPAAMARGAARPPAVASGGTETVLLVEDEDTVRLLARRTLERQGYTVIEAPNGRDALKVVSLHPGAIDLVLTDVVMPGMGGRELVSRLVEQHPSLKVIFMSGYTDTAVSEHRLIEPGVAFFQKPFTPGSLARVVREMLDAVQS